MTPEEAKQMRLERLREVRANIANTLEPEEKRKPTYKPQFAGDIPNEYCERYGHTWSAPSESARVSKIHFPHCVYCSAPGPRVDLN